MTRILPAVALAALAAASARAEPPPTGQADEVVVHAPRAVVVTATNCPAPDPARYGAAEPPRVVDSYPRAGAVVPPGATLVRVSFDAPMTCYSEVMVDGPGDPCQPVGAWDLPARRSFTMQCRLQPGTEYVVKFRKIDGEGFIGLSGLRAEPFTLAFTTSDGAETASLADAARLDPGPPGRPASYGSVACTDSRGAARRDCLRRVVTPR